MLLRICTLGLLIAVGATATIKAQDVNVSVSPSFPFRGDGQSEYPTIQNALDHAAQPGAGGRLYIHILPGVYKERVYISQLRPRTTLIGEGKDPSQVVITASQNVHTAQSTFFTETVDVLGNDFQADNLTFENDAGATGQAVAIAVAADRAIFKKCRFIGFQDTLFANYGRQFYIDSYISGAVDFIFGDAAAVFENSEIHITHPGYLTAQARTSAAEDTGYVFLHDKVTADDLGGKTFVLGRPWRAFARVIYLDTELPASLNPKGWYDWKRDTKDVYFAERGNTGPGANTASRVSWSHQLSAAEARQYQPSVFLAGTDHWNPEAEAAKLP
jgi:pectinesterase